MAKMFLFFSSVAVDKSCFKLKSADAASNELIFLKRVSTGQINTFSFLREEFHASNVPNMECATTFGMIMFVTGGKGFGNNGRTTPKAHKEGTPCKLSANRCV